MKSAYHKAFIRQHGQSDCGVACLASLVKYFKGNTHLETLRQLSGTTQQGTTLLGIHQAASDIGLNSEAYEADIPSLKESTCPCILHVTLEGKLEHYVVCYEYKNGKFIISDPAIGIIKLSDVELDNIWVSKALLLVNPTENFKVSKNKEQSYWKRLNNLIKEDYNILGISLALGVAIVILSLSTAVFTQKLIDNILPQSHTSKLVLGLALLFFLLLIKNGISYIRQHFLNIQSKEFNGRLIDHFYGSLLFLPKSFFDSRKTGELVARMNDTVRIQSAVSHLGANLMIDFLLVFVSVVFLFFYSPLIGAISIIYIPVCFFVTYLFNHKIIRSQNEVMNSYAVNESNYINTIQGIKEIKSSGKESFFTEITKGVYSNFQQKIFDLGKVRMAFNFFTDSSATLIIVTIISLGSWMALKESLKLGELMAIIQMAGMMIPAAGRLALTNIQLQEARVAFERMDEFTSIKPEFTTDTENEKVQLKDIEKIELKSVGFSFPGRSPVLSNISFETKKGEITAILGESGCGKSTTLHLIEKLHTAQTGYILANNINLEQVSTPSWRKLVACVPQEIKIFSGNINDNVCLGNYESSQSMHTFYKKYGFDHYFEKLPQGYFTVLGEGGVNLSGGQKQLLALARALYQNPKLLLLDEPTASLDPKTEKIVLNIIGNIKKEMAIILITHNYRNAAIADNIYILNQGILNRSKSHVERSRNIYQ